MNPLAMFRRIFWLTVVSLLRFDVLTRLYSDELGRQGLEEVAIPLWQRMRNLLSPLGPPRDGESWFVCYTFPRPIDWLTLRPKVRYVLELFMSETDRRAFKRDLTEGFELEVFRASKLFDTFFVPGGHSDDQSGGWLLGELEVNLNTCIQEKLRKIAQFRDKYPVWWLVLADHIGYGLDDFDQSMFRDLVSLTTVGFDKIVLLDPRKHRRSFVI